jgi:hypothetical protein
MTSSTYEIDGIVEKRAELLKLAHVTVMNFLRDSFQMHDEGLEFIDDEWLGTMHSMAVQLFKLNPQEDIEKLKTLSNHRLWQEYCENVINPTLSSVDEARYHKK